MRLFSFLFVNAVFQHYCIAQRVSSVAPQGMKITAKVIPNPIKDKLTLQVKNCKTGVVSIQIISANGTTVYNDKRLVVLATDTITIFLPFKAGNYFVYLKQDDQSTKCTFVVIP